MKPSAVMKLYDTARGAVVPFEVGEVVTMYTCGITPYDATHIGHASTYLTYDMLQRRLPPAAALRRVEPGMARDRPGRRAGSCQWVRSASPWLPGPCAQRQGRW